MAGRCHARITDAAENVSHFRDAEQRLVCEPLGEPLDELLDCLG